MPFFDVDEVRAAAEGRWGEILGRAGLPSSVMDGRGHPCPKCGGRDRFAVFHSFESRGAVHCRYCFTSGSPVRPGDGIQTLRWWFGCSFAEALQFVVEAIGGVPSERMWTPTARWLREAPLQPSQSDSDGHYQFARCAYERIGAQQRVTLSRQLGVSVDALRTLRVGINPEGTASCWPMRDAEEHVVGVRMATLPWEARESRKCRAPEVAAGSSFPAVSHWTAVSCGSPKERPIRRPQCSLGMWAIGRASCGSSTWRLRASSTLRSISRAQHHRLMADADTTSRGRRACQATGRKTRRPQDS